MAYDGPLPNFANPNALNDPDWVEHVNRTGKSLEMHHTAHRLDPDEREAVVAHKQDSKKLSWRLIDNHMESIGEKRERPDLSLDDTMPGGSKTYREHHEALTRAIDKIGKPLKSDTMVFSGVHYKMGRRIAETKKDDTFFSPGWVCCSVDPRIAHNFSRRDEKGGVEHIVQFKLPTGSQHGAYIAHLDATYRNEREFLMKPNTRWKRTRTVKHGNKYVHTLEPA